MNFTYTYQDRADEIIALFAASFSDSEGAAEGEIIRNLADNLISNTPKDDMFVFSALEDDRVIGAIVFTRLVYPDDVRTVFLLSPVAVATGYQGKGVGQSLLTYGLDILRDHAVDIAITYGDIKFYSKVGFAHISQDMAKAPLPLSHPRGWLGQCLSSPGFEPLIGHSFCADAFNNPDYW